MTFFVLLQAYPTLSLFLYRLTYDYLQKEFFLNAWFYEWVFWPIKVVTNIIKSHAIVQIHNCEMVGIIVIERILMNFFFCFVTGVFLLMMIGVFGIAAGCLVLFVNPYDVLFKLVSWNTFFWWIVNPERKGIDLASLDAICIYTLFLGDIP